MRMPRSRISSRQLGEPSGPGAASAARVPPWPSGLSAMWSLLASKILPVWPVDRRHLPLDEEADVLQAEAAVLLEERRSSPRGSPGWS